MELHEKCSQKIIHSYFSLGHAELVFFFCMVPYLSVEGSCCIFVPLKQSFGTICFHKTEITICQEDLCISKQWKLLERGLTYC